MDVSEALLPLQVDRDDELPVGVQLAWTLRAMISRGRLQAGDRLPGLREAAEQAGVNVNTVRSVYSRLEAAGLLSSRQGLGTFVRSPLPESEALGTLADEFLDRARERGLDPRELARVVYAAAQPSETVGEGTGLPDVGREADEAAARRELRRQIGRLEAQLASYPDARQGSGVHPLLRPKAHVAGVEELEAVRDGLIELLKEARSKEERRGEKQSRARGRRERVIGDPDSHRWQRVRREDCGDPGCGETSAVPRFGPIGAIAGWWRVKVSSGCP